MRAGLEWVFALRRFLIVVGMSPLGLVLVLGLAGFDTGQGLAVGIALVWPVAMIWLILRYRSFNILGDVTVIWVLVLGTMPLAPGLESRLSAMPLASAVLLLVACLLAAVMLWLVLHMAGVAIALRDAGRKGQVRRLRTRVGGRIAAQAAFDGLRLAPDRSTAFHDTGPQGADGWFDYQMKSLLIGDAPGHDGPERDENAADDMAAPRTYARIVEETDLGQLVAFATDDGASLVFERLEVRPHGTGCIVLVEEVTDVLTGHAAVNYWLRDFGRFSMASRLDHLAGVPNRFGGVGPGRGLLIDLGAWFARQNGSDAASGV